MPVQDATRRTRPAARLLAALCGGLLVAAALVPMLLGRPRTGPAYDLGVYRAGGESVLRGLSLYAPDFLARAHFHDGFTYPPSAALAFVPLALVPAAAAYWSWTVISLVLLGVLVAESFPALLGRVAPRWRPLALGALTAVAVLTVPVAEHLSLGQVGIAITLAALLDVTGRVRWLPRGVLVGLATAVKLTPGLFLVHYALTRQWRPLATAVGTTTACWAAAWLVLPADSTRYFLHGLMTDSSRAGSVLEVANQSLWGTTHRLLGPGAGPVWILACVAVGAVGLARAARAHRAGDLTAAATLVGLTSVLLSPVSWMHAGMWLVPAVGLLVRDGRGRRGVVAGLAVLALTSVLVPHPPDPTSGPWVVRAWHESLVACYLILVAALPIRRAAPDGGGGGTPADREPHSASGPVPRAQAGAVPAARAVLRAMSSSAARVAALAS